MKPACLACIDTGHVCEEHSDTPIDECDPWECGIGMPCPTCCDPIPLDGTHSITEAFIPRAQRGH